MLSMIAKTLVSLVALVHIVIAVVEMFFWSHPKVHGRLDFTPEQAQQAGMIVANAGLYNGFLAAGLIWSLTLKSDGRRTATFFLACVIIAGLFGVTLAYTTLAIQTLPGVVALFAVWTTRPKAERK